MTSDFYLYKRCTSNKKNKFFYLLKTDKLVHSKKYAQVFFDACEKCLCSVKKKKAKHLKRRMCYKVFIAHKLLHLQFVL